MPQFQITSVAKSAEQHNATFWWAQTKAEAPKTLPKRPDFSAYFEHSDLCVARFKGVKFIPRYGAVCDPSGALLGDTTLPIFHKNHRHYLSTPKEVISTPVILLGGQNNYYHCMFNWMSKAYALSQIGMLPSSIPLVVNTNLAQYQVEMFRAAGFSRIFSIFDDECVQFEDAIVASMFAPPIHSAGHIAWLRSLFLGNKPSPAGRKIYISRKDAEKNNRQILNEADLETLLHKYGFETIALADHSVAEQAAIFRHADHIVSPHGAGLSNLAFASKGVRVCELQAEQHYTKVFWSLGLQCGAKCYDILDCKGTGDVPNYQKDLTVDLEALDVLLKQKWNLPRDAAA